MLRREIYTALSQWYRTKIQDCTEHMHCEIPLSTQISKFNIQIFIVSIGWHELRRWKKWTWDKKFSHTTGKLWPAETCCELTHSHQWNEKNGKIKSEVTNWAHLLLCSAKQIYIMGSTMHNVNFLTFTYHVKNIPSSTSLKTRDRLTRMGITRQCQYYKCTKYNL